MRRIVLPLLVLGTLFLSSDTAQARHGRHCFGGYGGGYVGGYCGGWGGGFGWGNGCWGNTYSTFSIGIRPYGGCYSPAYYNSCYAPDYGSCYSGYGGTFLYGSLSPYGTYYNPQANYLAYNLPPVYQPAEIAYGPLAAKQFLGLSRNYAMGPLRRPTVAIPRVAVKPAVRVSNAEARRKADTYIAQGDELFREQKYHSAVQKYKAAAESAPNVAEAYWRQGHALVASNRYELAAGCFKRALAVDGDILRGGFSLDELYGSASVARQSHLEALAADALERSTSSDPYFVLGVFLQYDGQQARAAKFFHRAAELAAGDAGHIAWFIPGTSEPATMTVSSSDSEI